MKVTTDDCGWCRFLDDDELSLLVSLAAAEPRGTEMLVTPHVSPAGSRILRRLRMTARWRKAHHLRRLARWG